VEYKALALCVPLKLKLWIPTIPKAKALDSNNSLNSQFPILNEKGQKWQIGLL
jgi:hypothetical protein